MRLALLLFALAAGLFALSIRLSEIDLVGAHVVEARRGPRAPETKGANETTSQGAPVEIVASAPLFRPAEAASDEAGLEPGRRFALIGLAGRPEARRAYLRDLADNQTWTARVGDRVGEWMVEDIDERCVLLRQRGERQTPCL